MSLTPDSQPGKLHLVQCSSEIEKIESFWGGESLDRARLVVASPELSARVTQQVPDVTAVVHLPSGVSASAEVAVGLARQTVLEGETVVWLVASPSDTNRPAGASGDVGRWFAEQGIACEAMVAGDARPRTLAGSWVLLGRPRPQVAETVHCLKALGATVVSQPAIAIGPPVETAPLDAAIGRLESYDWLVFSSANGVRFLLERLWARSGDLRRLGKVKLAAIGPGTAEALGEYRLRADVVPPEYRAEALAEALSDEAPGKRFLLARASRGREVLAERLLASGAEVDQVVVYQSTDVCPTEPQSRPVMRLLDEGRIDWVVVTSTAIARSLERLFGRRLEKTRLASISPVTSAALRELGHEPAVEARRYTLDGVIEAMVGHAEQHGKLK